MKKQGKVKKAFSKFLVCILMSAMCLMGAAAVGGQDASAASISQSDFNSKLSSLRASYPNYSTWTGSFDGGTQCYGFARLVAYSVFGEHADSWSKSYDISTVKAGDLVQYGNTSGSGHTIFVTSVSGSTITFVDCNGNGNYSGGTKVRTCGIKWDNTISMSSKMFSKYSFSYVLSSPGVSTDQEPVGCVDSVTAGTESITVSGWAYDPDSPSTSIDVHVYVGGPAGSGTGVGVATANVSRTDVNTAFGITGNHGFSFTIDLTGTGLTGSQTVYVYAINAQSGSNPLIGSGTVTITANRDPVGCLDSVKTGAGTITLTGWTYDPDASSASLVVHVYVGGPAGTGTKVGEATANVTRDDVNTAYGISGKHGFSFTIDLTDTGISGSQTVYVYAINNKSGNNPLIGSRTVTITGNSSPVGYLDTAVGNAGSLTVSGWAYDPDSSGTSITVHIYVGGPAGSGTLVASVTANKTRTDVNSAAGISGDHGYSCTIDLRKYNLTGSKSVYVYGIDLSGRVNSLLTSAPKTVTISSPYTITYNANGGSGAPSTGTKAYGISETLSSTQPTRDGYTFTGWNTEAGGSGTAYSAGGSYKANASVTLYAQWEADPAGEEPAVSDTDTTESSDTDTSEATDSEVTNDSSAEATGTSETVATDTSETADTNTPETADADTTGATDTDMSVSSAADSLSLRRGNTFYINYDFEGGEADLIFTYGQGTDEVLVGDWNGDGIDTLCVRRGNRYYISNTLGGGADYTADFGRDTDEVIVGDWDGDGVDTLCIRRGNRYYISNSLKSGNAEVEFVFGRAADTVFAGDWDGDGCDTLCIRRGNTCYIDNTLEGGNAAVAFAFGKASDEVIVGDWDGDGCDTLCIRRGNMFYISNALEGGNAEIAFAFGKASDEVLSGRWK